jgi:hypothetical protein
LDVNTTYGTNFVVESTINSLNEKYPENIILMTEKTMRKEFLTKLDLMIVSLESWKTLVDSQSTWLTNVPSVLIIKP